MKKYFVQTKIDGETFSSIKTEKELAELWENDNECGYLDGLVAFDIDTFGQPKQVNVYEIATEYIKGRDEMQREYEDYCETVREYGYDYYEEFIRE